MRYVKGYNVEKEHNITGKDMLVSALAVRTGKTEKELKKISKAELRKMWNELQVN